MLSCVLLTEAFKVKYNLVHALKMDNVLFLLLFPSHPSILQVFLFFHYYDCFGCDQTTVSKNPIRRKPHPGYLQYVFQKLTKS